MARTPEVKAGGGGVGAGREVVPRKRIVRRKSLVQRCVVGSQYGLCQVRPRRLISHPRVSRVKDLPSTLVDKVVFFSLNFNLDALARPLGLFLAVLQFLLRAPMWRKTATVGRKSVLRAAGSAGVENRKWEGRFGDVPKVAKEKLINLVCWHVPPAPRSRFDRN